ERLVDRVTVAGEQQRVAVGRDTRDQLGGDVRSGAGAVLDHDLPTEVLAERLCDDAREGVDAAARREADHESDLAAGKFPRARRRATRAPQKQAGQGGNAAWSPPRTWPRQRAASASLNALRTCGPWMRL